MYRAFLDSLVSMSRVLLSAPADAILVITLTDLASESADIAVSADLQLRSFHYQLKSP
jgi:hypothetical protein